MSNYFVIPWTVAHQAPLSIEAPRQKCWSCHFLLQRIFLTQGSNLHLLHWQVDSLPLRHQGSPPLPFPVHFVENLGGHIGLGSDETHCLRTKTIVQLARNTEIAELVLFKLFGPENIRRFDIPMNNRRSCAMTSNQRLADIFGNTNSFARGYSPPLSPQCACSDPRGNPL